LNIFKNIRKYVRFRKFSSVHIRGRNNILLFSTPRSGSTWLLEMIAHQPRIKTVREPFNIRKEPVRKMLGMSSWVELYTDENFPAILRYLKSFSNNLKVDSGFKMERPFSDTWHPITNRIVYKILHSMENRVEELKAELHAKALILVRHPIPVTLSRIELPRLLAFQHSDFRKLFNQQQIMIAEQITQNGTEFEKGIVSWCFQNRLLLNSGTENLLVTYEEMVTNRECVIKKIASFFDLLAPEKMMVRSKKASGSTVKSSEKNQNLLHAVEEGDVDSRRLIEKWRRQVTPEMIEQAQHILDIFEIDIYKADELMPSEKMMLCRDTDGFIKK
jgi:hypothetical protein